jgi:RNA polymerase sigma-54 factor
MFSGARGAVGKDEDEGPRAAAAALRHRLGRIVAAESPQAPLTDAALAEQLAQETGVTLARRTVAQYREAEGIPPAHLRRRMKKTVARRNSGQNVAN